MEDISFSILSYPYRQDYIGDYLPYTTKDAIQRNPIYADLHKILYQFYKTVTTLKSYEEKIYESMTSDEYTTFTQRWNLFSFKLSQLEIHMTRSEFSSGLKYAHSLIDDVTVMRSIVNDVAGRCYTYVQCDHFSQSFRLTRALAILSVMIVLIIYTSSLYRAKLRL